MGDSQPPLGAASAGSSVDPDLLRHSVVDPAARLDYVGAEPVRTPPAAPLTLLAAWFDEVARDPRVSEPNAMVVATVDADGLPDARTVLLKGLDPRGFTFFTSTVSAKAAEIAANPAASVVLLWHPVFRQVRARGVVEAVDDAEADAYFATRPRGSQVSAWASQQSHEVASREDVEEAFAAAGRRFADVDRVPRPPFWGGYRVRPVEVEFWVGQASRLHDRVAYLARDGAPAALDDASAWRVTRRQP
ncbi:pyridoxamine 5'-phosphate oxidase [Thalassiella azotivora]